MRSSELIGLALALAAGCGHGRVVGIPKGFSAEGRTLRVEARGKPRVTASAGAHQARLRELLAAIDCVPLLAMAARHSLPARLRAMADRRAGVPLRLTLELERLDLLAEPGGTGWWLRVDAVATLVDPGDDDRRLWRHAASEVAGAELSGRALRGLLAENLVIEGPLKRELSLHLRDVLGRLLADLDRVLAGPR